MARRRLLYNPTRWSVSSWIPVRTPQSIPIQFTLDCCPRFYSSHPDNGRSPRSWAIDYNIHSLLSFPAVACDSSTHTTNKPKGMRILEIAALVAKTIFLDISFPFFHLLCSWGNFRHRQLVRFIFVLLKSVGFARK